MTRWCLLNTGRQVGIVRSKLPEGEWIFPSLRSWNLAEGNGEKGNNEITK